MTEDLKTGLGTKILKSSMQKTYMFHHFPTYTMLHTQICSHLEDCNKQARADMFTFLPAHMHFHNLKFAERSYETCLFLAKSTALNFYWWWQGKELNLIPHLP